MEAELVSFAFVSWELDGKLPTGQGFPCQFRRGDGNAVQISGGREDKKECII